jgi:hypothetical protein
LKKLILMLIVSFMLVGCGQKVTEEEFVSFSSDFYIQMFMDGEQSKAVNELYETYIEEYKGFEDDELHQTLVSMYKGFENGSASEHQLSAMKMLNER